MATVKSFPAGLDLCMLLSNQQLANACPGLTSLPPNNGGRLPGNSCGNHLMPSCDHYKTTKADKTIKLAQDTPSENNLLLETLTATLQCAFCQKTIDHPVSTIKDLLPELRLSSVGHSSWSPGQEQDSRSFGLGRLN